MEWSGTIGRRVATVLGGLCLGATLLLTPLGVRTVAADGEVDAVPETEQPMPEPQAVKPEVALPSGAETVGPAAPAPDDRPMRVRPGPTVELDVVDAPEIVPLNTQGYNYRPTGPVR
jgi:hypothetical protein